MFVETNPIPIKAALAMAGLIRRGDSPAADAAVRPLRPALTELLQAAGVKLDKRSR